jgi:hypothetical protein
MKFFTEMFYDTRVGVVEFHFERVGYPTTTGYKVAVITGTHKTYNLIMQEVEGQWKITEASRLPVWITDFQTLLSDSILAHYKKHQV